MKPGTYTQIYIQLVFAPKFREALLQQNIRDRLNPFIGTVLKNKGHKPLIINGMPDHIHILFGLNPKQSISDLVADIKRSSSLFVNEQKFLPGKFLWQDGYGAFTVSQSALKDTIHYIQNQREHHQRKSFKDEYLAFLHKHGIAFDERYVFD